MTPGQIRAVAMSLPEVSERATWGRPTFRVGNKLFATLARDGSSATLKSSVEAQRAVVGANPDTFTIAAYLGRHGWITARLDVADKTLTKELVMEAWRRAAPRRLLI
ncbi:MAG: MmcQ/YjbR family DNA-binding protein [Candidatus Dormibacteria bacterium]|jgi:hypothetical protein